MLGRRGTFGFTRSERRMKVGDSMIEIFVQGKKSDCYKGDNEEELVNRLGDEDENEGNATLAWFIPFFFGMNNCVTS